MMALNKSSDKYSGAKLELCDNSITITTTNGTIPCGTVIDDELVTAYMKDILRAYLVQVCGRSRRSYLPLR